jgi:hypothetical protein
VSHGRGRASSPRVLFRRSPYVVSYWSPRGLALENYATGRRGGGAPLVHDILGIFDRWRPIDDLCKALPRTPRSTLARVVDALAGLTFLQRSDRPPHPAEAALTAWRGWNPAAAFFHCSTKDVKFATDIDASVRRVRAVARRDPMPSAIKRYRGAPRIRLPLPSTDTEFPRVLLGRRTWRRELERLSKDATPRQVTKYLPGQSWYNAASALVLLTAVFARTQWRYPFARAYRVVLAEAGHLCQTFCLTASWLGLAPFCTMALADSAIERDLGIDGVSESVIYAAGFGTRPGGVDWAPWPSLRRRSRASTSAGRSGSA